MSQATVTTTTPHVTAVCSGALTHYYDSYIDSYLVGITRIGQHDVVVQPQLILRVTRRGYAGLTTSLLQHQH